LICFVVIAQVDVGSDKKFSTKITAGGTMKYEGTYTITAQYGVVNRLATTSFEFGGSTTPTPTPTPTDASFPVEYVVIAVAIVVAAGLGIRFLRGKKAAPAISASPAKSKTTQRQDDTQFWVCPHCGGDTQYRKGKQFCSSCNMYL